VATGSDVRDPEWRQIDPSADFIEEPIPGKEYGETYSEDATQLSGDIIIGTAKVETDSSPLAAGHDT